MMFTVFLSFCLKLLLTLDPPTLHSSLFSHNIVSFSFSSLIYFFSTFSSFTFFWFLFTVYIFALKELLKHILFCFKKCLIQKVSRCLSYSGMQNYLRKSTFLVLRECTESYDFKDVLIFQLIFFNHSYFS